MHKKRGSLKPSRSPTTAFTQREQGLAKVLAQMPNKTWQLTAGSHASQVTSFLQLDADRAPQLKAVVMRRSQKAMNASDKQLGELVLRRMCVGGQIDGIRFGPVLQILISHTNHPNLEPINGQVYLNLGSRWKVFDSRPQFFPDNEKELPEVAVEKQIQEITDLRERIIVDAELAADEPHLILSLDDDRIVFVNGKHEAYECWDVGVAFSGDMWQVVACPGGGVAVWAPKNVVPSGA